MHFTRVYSTIGLVLAGSSIEAIGLKEWRWIAQGRGSCPWMINFHVNQTVKNKAVRNKTEQEFSDAVRMLQGLIQAGSYAVGEDFPDFIRIPSVFIYEPNNTHPHIFEMRKHKAPANELVEYIKRKVIRDTNDPWLDVCGGTDAPIEYVPPMISTSKLFTALKGYLEGKNLLVFVTDNKGIDHRIGHCLSEIAKLVYSSDEYLEHGWIDISGVGEEIAPFMHYLVVPGIVLCVSSNLKQDSRIYAYRGDFKHHQIVQWVYDKMKRHHNISSHEAAQSTTQLNHPTHYIEEV